MRLIPLASTSLLAVWVGFSPVYAQQLSEADRYKLCSDSPSDLQCKGYKAPVVLDDRPGEAGACVMITNKVESQTVCKLAVGKNKVIAYYEVGEKLRFLNKRKATHEIQLNSSDIKALQYQEGSKDNSTARVVNTLLLGWGGLFTADKAVSEIAIDYIIPLPIESTSSATVETQTVETQTVETDSKFSNALAKMPETLAAANANEPMNRIKVVVRRKTGKNLRLQLEQLTGIKAEMPAPREEKQPKPEPSELQN